MNEQTSKLITQPHHRSKTRLPMPEQKRAAQFAPFAALSGYEGVIRETARLTAPKRELAEDKIAEIDLRLQQLSGCADSAPQVCITYFVPDRYKTGGSLRTVQGIFKAADPVRRKLLLTDGTQIPINTVTDIAGELWDKF